LYLSEVATGRRINQVIAYEPAFLIEEELQLGVDVSHSLKPFIFDIEDGRDPM
jgi:hypothetical protein